jgi:uncharacterized phiE125 gp8 family phage protein
MDRHVRVVEAPKPIVSWDEMRTHGKIEEESEKTYVETLIEAATGWIDGPTGWLGRTIGVQVLELQLSDWPCSMADLPYGPIIELVSVVYLDADGAEHLIDVHGLSDDFDLPTVEGRPGDVRIRYRAGYGVLDDATPPKWVNTPPAAIKVAVMMIVSEWYESRSPVSVGSSFDELPIGPRMLLQPYRVYR